MTWLEFGGQRSRSQQVVEVTKASASTLGRQSSSFGCFGLAVSKGDETNGEPVGRGLHGKRCGGGDCMKLTSEGEVGLC